MPALQYPGHIDAPHLPPPQHRQVSRTPSTCTATLYHSEALPPPPQGTVQSPAGQTRPARGTRHKAESRNPGTVQPQHRGSGSPPHRGPQQQRVNMVVTRHSRATATPTTHQGSPTPAPTTALTPQPTPIHVPTCVPRTPPTTHPKTTTTTPTTNVPHARCTGIPSLPPAVQPTAVATPAPETRAPRAGASTPGPPAPGPATTA